MEPLCTQFTLGRPGSGNAGKCSLFKGTCTKNTDETRDLFISSIKVNPSKSAAVCTHTQQYSADKLYRDQCSKVTSKETCLQLAGTTGFMMFENSAIPGYNVKTIPS